MNDEQIDQYERDLRRLRTAIVIAICTATGATLATFLS
jgi:hypothetical protein